MAEGKGLVFVAMLGVALSACSTNEKSAPPPAPVATAAPTPVVAPPPLLQPAQPGPWRITKTAWTKADEDGFGEFLRQIAESGCTTTVSCMQSAANFYHDTDPPAFRFHADCAKWAYMLRAYYASKNGLPFSYVDRIAGEGGDLRFAKTSNLALARRDIVDRGQGIDTAGVLYALHDQVSTATYRMDPTAETPVLQDFYSPKIEPGSIRPGTAIYDINGHVMIVYEVTDDGSILYMDAHPGESVTRGFYGAQVARSPLALGGGFKNFRPQTLVGAERHPDGTYVGGHVVLAANDAIADYSLEQYRGAEAADASTEFRYNNVPLNLYEYTRAAMSKGGFAFNPVYELEVTMGSLCRDARLSAPEADMRIQSGLGTLYADLTKAAEQFEQRDLRVVYHGLSLKQTLAATYAAQEQACVADRSGAGGQQAANPVDPFANGAPATNVHMLIAQMNDSAPFAQMRPVGY